MLFRIIKNKFVLISLKILKKLIKKFFNKNYPPLINKILINLEYKEFFKERDLYKTSFISSHSDIKWILEELESRGFCVIRDFWSEGKCLRGIKEIETLIKDFPEFLHKNNKSDSRIYGAENISDIISSFSSNKLLTSIANEYNAKHTKLGFTLAAKMPFKSKNKGSGEGWHRDAFFRQFKTILYLSKVGYDNGPFELIRNSHKCKNIIEDMEKGNLDYKQFRLEESQIEKILVNQPQRKKTIIGDKGTLILVDTSTLHRGAPIKESTRYALTNYYYTVNQIDSELYKKFNVVPKKFLKN